MQKICFGERKVNKNNTGVHEKKVSERKIENSRERKGLPNLFHVINTRLSFSVGSLKTYTDDPIPIACRDYC